MERGVGVRPNFHGCLENVLYVSPSSNSILDVLQNLQRQNPFYGLEQGMVGSGAMCEVSQNQSLSLSLHIKTSIKTFIIYFFRF
jgi:hypothetical protein